MGFWQRSMLPLFGFYPWECVLCRHKRYLHSDGKRRVESSSA
jgi:hypothetical protein